LDVRQFGAFYIPSGPYVLPSNKNYWPAGFDGKVRCFDKDNDGYCNWGVSDIGFDKAWRAANCPLSCNNTPEKDSNDADPFAGPFEKKSSEIH